ncbi:MAG TPA: phytanoyl-CoA dioxygenase, partial [Saprospiraceae bacterium]|nr:phytanoyl-CoA dioxygenase [Saprospiraceae bacterium]
MSTALQRLFAPYKGLLRRLKAAYVINNWLNADGLRHNRDLYRRYGLRKSIFAPIGYADFDGQHHPDIPWLDQPDAALRLERHPQFASFEPAVQEQMKCFVREGYMILRGLVGQDETDALNAQVEEMLHSGQARYNYTGRKIFNLWERSDLADREFFRRPELLRILSFLLGKTVIPFQSMNFTMGSEQRAHSDLIHM